MESRPLVSVIVTNYNYGHFLDDCLASIRAQTHAPLQVIIVDDGSTDDSPARLDELAAGYEVIVQANQGQLAAFRTGAQAVRGEIVCLLDADDVWDARKVASVVAVLSDHPEAQWVRHDTIVADSKLADTGARIAYAAGPIASDPLLYTERVVMANTSTIALRAPLWNAVLAPAESGSPLQYDADAFLLARIASLGATGYSIAESLGTYRRHDGQQFHAHDDFRKMIERQVAVGRLICAVVGQPAESVSNYKLGAISAALRGDGLWSAARAGALPRALPAMRGLLRRPLLLARQTTGLLFAIVWPRGWLRRLARNQGLAAP